MARTIFLYLLLLAILPPAGLSAFGVPLGRYFEFPPDAQYVTHANFSLAVFAALAVGTLALLAPAVYRLLRAPHSAKEIRSSGRFPAWGGFFIAWTAGAWILAWSRSEALAWLQPHTFPLLWLGYIGSVNAFSQWKKGSCLARRSPRRFALLFILSAGFWWYFEYLNRFVQNWFYIHPQFESAEYVLHASIAFSTVLPAVASTAELTACWWRLQRLEHFAKIDLAGRRPAAMLLLSTSCAALFFIGLQPNWLYPFLWIAPLFLYLSLTALLESRNAFPELANGNWQKTAAWALAALICGFFWEMWNYESLSKWRYSIPFVEALFVFEMPLLGYAGYLPFGLECRFAADWVLADGHSESADSPD